MHGISYVNLCWMHAGGDKDGKHVCSALRRSPLQQPEPRTHRCASALPRHSTPLDPLLRQSLGREWSRLPATSDGSRRSLALPGSSPPARLANAPSAPGDVVGSQPIASGLDDFAEGLRKAGQEVIETPFDAVYSYAGAFRCWHHPLVRETKS